MAALQCLTLHPRINIYIDYSINWCGPNYANVNKESKYNHITVCFYVYDDPTTPHDFLKQLCIDQNGCAKIWIKEMQDHGMKVLFSWGGGVGLPTKKEWYDMSRIPTLVQKLSKIVQELGFDGIDIDWEDDYTQENPGLCGFEGKKVPGKGPAIPWLIAFTQALRQQLGPQKLISHAPQAPYFPLGYDVIYSRCGDAIDFLNVQFYNQGKDAFTTYSQLFESYRDCSISDLVEKYHIPPEKILCGKPALPQDQTAGGYIEPNEFRQILQQGLRKYPKLGGAMAWMWHHQNDINMAFSSNVALAWQHQ